MAWPPENKSPTPDNPLYCSGEYSKDPCNVSPEGNVYGQMRVVGLVPHYYWWTGDEWAEIKKETIAGQANSVHELPVGRPHGEIWQVRRYDQASNKYFWDEYFFDAASDEWEPIDWLWIVDHVSALPHPGNRVGEGHLVREEDVLAIWNGLDWVRPKHSALNQDEPEKHLPDGFLTAYEGDLGNLQDQLDIQASGITVVGDQVNGLVALSRPADAQVYFVDHQHIGIRPLPSTSGKVWVQSELINAAGVPQLLVTSLVVNRLGADQLQTEAIAADTEYLIYLGNNYAGLNLSAQDCRGRLFLSRDADIDGYLSDAGPGHHARLVGKIETDGTPFFVKELDISKISERTSFPETFREFSDYQVVYVDQETLSLQRIPNTYGQIYICGTLYYLGETDIHFYRDQGIVGWDGSGLTFDPNPAQPNTLYYIYIPANIAPFYFLVNGVPFDFRLKPFLSTKAPENGRMDESWPGYYARFIGMVRTDAYGLLINSYDISQIRQLTLKPSYFDGLAEISLVPVSETELRVCRKGGTSGICMVCGVAVQFHEQFDAAVHKVMTTDIVQEYVESDQADPLHDLNAVSSYTGQDLYVYVANNRPIWGADGNKLFVSTKAPERGFLSANYPGNNARWLAKIRPDAQGRFTGSYVRDAIVQPQLRIDDSGATLNDTWSGAKIQAKLNEIMATINTSQAFETQKAVGCPVALSFLDSSHIAITPVSSGAAVIFPDLTMRSITDTIIQLVTIAPNIIHYVWLKQNAIEISTSPPTATYNRLQTKGTDAVLIGYLYTTSSNYLFGPQSVYSFLHEPQRSWSGPMNSTYLGAVVGGQQQNGATKNHLISIPSLLVPPGIALSFSRTGITTWQGGKTDAGRFQRTVVTGYDEYIQSVYQGNVYYDITVGRLEADFVMGPLLLSEVRAKTDIHIQNTSYTYNYVVEVTSETGDMIVTRPGS